MMESSSFDSIYVNLTLNILSLFVDIFAPTVFRYAYIVTRCNTYVMCLQKGKPDLPFYDMPPVK